MTDLLDGEWRRPAPALLTVRRVEVVLFVALPFVVATAVLAVLAGPPEAIATASAGGVLTSLSLIAVQRRWQAWGYAERQEDLLVRRGVLVRRTSVVPYGRMQYVDVTAGPIDRALGLATVRLHTASAASDATVPGLTTEAAALLRDRLTAAGQARLAGL